MPTLPFFEDLTLFVTNSLFIAGFFDSDKVVFLNSRDCFLKGEAVNSFVLLAVDCFA